MTTLADVQYGIAYAIQTGLVSDSYPEGLRVEELVRDGINAPCAEVVRREFDPRFIFSGVKSAYQFTVRVFARRDAERAAQVFLNDLADLTADTSLTLAVQNGDNWPDTVTVDYAEVTRIGEIVAVERDQIVYLMVEFDIEVVF